MDTNMNYSKDANTFLNKRELLFKFLVIGDFGVGKTSIIRRYAEGTFSPTYKITIGADFAIKSIDWDDTTRINLQLWDIAGHERFGCLTSVYYRYAVAAAIVFDLTRPQTFYSLEKWLFDLKDKCALHSGNPIPVILLANKADVCLPPVLNEVDDFCKKHGILARYVTSAKENINIGEAMQLLLKTAYKNYYHVERSDSIQLSKAPILETPSKKCC